MNVISVKIDELVPYENNPRKNDTAVDSAVESIKQFGFKVPIVIDSKNVIVCGHTRYKACKKLGFNEIPCVVADDLTEEQIKAFRIADNKVAEQASWDIDKLNFEISQLPEVDFSKFGFLGEESLIDSLLETGVGETNSTQENFAITFIFPVAIKDAVMGKMKEYGKDFWTQKIIELFEV